MHKISLSQCVGWGFVVVVALSFVVALLFGSPKLSGFVFFSTMLFSFLPFFIFPFRSVLAGRSFKRGVLIGWGTFALSQLLFFILYAALYPKYRDHGWGSVEGQGVAAGFCLGWIPGFLIAAVALFVRRMSGTSLEDLNDDNAA